MAGLRIMFVSSNGTGLGHLSVASQERSRWTLDCESLYHRLRDVRER